MLPYPEFLRPDGTRCDYFVAPSEAPQVPSATGRWLLHALGNGFEGKVEPGRLRIVIQAPDLINEPVDLELAPGESRQVRMAVGIGRSRSLVFLDARVPIDSRDVLHVEVVDATGAVSLRQDLRQSPHGDGAWTLEHPFAFGAYQVTARSDSGRRYGGSFEVREDLTETTRVGVAEMR
jgi:hypothetical protein